MFYSEAILSRRGPLAKVWLAAHWERKLSKAQTMQTDISESVEALLGQEVEVMALRLSGQLLLGVVRIYSRKAKYLLDDCNEALLKIKMAFRPGAVDMTEDQLAVNKNAITLQPGPMNLDMLMPDINWDLDFDIDRPQRAQGQHIAREADITLASAHDLTFGEDDLGAFDLDLDNIGSQDFELDLGINFGDEQDETMEVEVGRDAGPQSPRHSIASGMLAKDGEDVFSSHGRAASLGPGGDMDIDFGGDAFDLDLGINFGDEREKTPGLKRSVSRESSPLTSLPATPPPPDVTMDNADNEKTPSPKKKKVVPKKQIVDKEIEMQDGPGGGRGQSRKKDLSAILAEQHFLPGSRTVMRLLEIRDDPLAHFFPTKTTPEGTFYCTAPIGLNSELTDLFLRPLPHLTTQPKRKPRGDGESPTKKTRLGAGDDDEIERARREGSAAPSQVLGSDVFGGRAGSVDAAGADFDFGGDFGGDMDMQFDIPPMPDAGEARDRSVAPSTPGPFGEEGDESYADCPIASFDVRQTQTQENEKEDSSGNDGKGYSKNTIKAMGLIRQKLNHDDDNELLSFRQASHGASRRAASSFFFELLVLGTRDCVKLSQPAPYENIKVHAKPKLWEGLQQQRAASVAPSTA